MTWALKRQISYIVIFLLFFGIFGFLLIYPSFNETPTCTDSKQNGTETGVDCGGSCTRACLFEADFVSVLWARSFSVVPGRYNALAYLENHNKSLVVNKIKYEFRFADKDNIFLGRRNGVAYVPPGKTFAVFEGGMELGDSVPIYTTFSFTELPQWVSVSEDKINQALVSISDILLENEKTNPSLRARIQNKSLFSIPNVQVVAILYDAERNAVSASSTYVDELSKEEEEILTFTWPMPFDKEIVNTEIIPIYNILNVKLR